MARRAGKAASRKSRQRRQQRSTQSPPAQAAARAAEPAGQPPTPDAPPAPTDAFEAADAEVRANTPPPGTRAEATGQRRTVRARVSDFHMSSSGPSRLNERAAAEYHYVTRDLRNIGVLLVVMVVLLAISAVIVNLIGIGATT